ncbi:MAG: hypothetical protein MUO23_07135 [Anaerolineales bacterium]|nr:hypothetical protein [Anaerolineales bacterium]
MLLGKALALLPITIWSHLPVVGLSGRFVPGLSPPGLLFLAGVVAAVTLRYRLLEADTLAHRTLVYAVLAAILARVSTAAVGLWQRLLVAFPGERSDAAVVITPLIVAAAFTPIRIWLQAIVDRPLKDPPGRVKARSQFGDQVGCCAEMTDATALGWRVLEEAIHDLGAQGGATRLTVDGSLSTVHRLGTERGAGWVAMPLVPGRERLGLMLSCPRKAELAHDPLDFETLVEVAQGVSRPSIRAGGRARSGRA